MTDHAADVKEKALKVALGRRQFFRAARKAALHVYDSGAMERETEIARRCLEPTDLERELGGRAAVKAWLASKS